MDEASKRKKYWPLIGMLLIGIVGSGLWELLIKDAILWLANAFVLVVSTVFSGYIDYIYQDVGKAYVTPKITYMPTIFLVVMMVSICLVSFLFLKELAYPSAKKSDVSEEQSNRTLFTHKLFFWGFGPAAILTGILYAELLISSFACDNAIKTIERNLEIIRPYTTTQNFIMLNSQFRLIDSKESMVLLLSEIDSLAEKNSVTIPGFSLLGID